MRLTVLLLVPLLAGCAMQSAYEPPIVEQRGDDPVKFQNDQGECIDRAKEGFGFNAPITRCMRDKGYTIIAPKG